MSRRGRFALAASVLVTTGLLAALLVVTGPGDGGSPSHALAALKSSQESSQQRTDSSAPSCPPGTLPSLNVARFPGPDDEGYGTPLDAVRAIEPRGPVSTMTMGPGKTAPVWAAANGQTFLVTTLSDGRWFASPATFSGCAAPPSLPVKQQAGSPSTAG